MRPRYASMPRGDVRHMESAAGRAASTRDAKHCRWHGRKAGRARRLMLLGYTDIEVIWTDPVDTARRVCALEGTSAVLACYACLPWSVTLVERPGSSRL